MHAQKRRKWGGLQEEKVHTEEEALHHVTRVACLALCQWSQVLVLAVPPVQYQLIVLRASVLLCLTAEYGSSSPGVPECPEFIDTVVTTSLFLLSPHKVLGSRGSSLQDLQILHHSTWAVVALADVPSHGFSSQRTFGVQALPSAHLCSGRRDLPSLQ